MASRFRIWTVLTGFTVSAVLLGCAANLHAQLATATLSGAVRDPSGAAVPGAQVTLESTVEQASRRTVTNSAGAYVIPAILPGSYRLAVRAQGFQAQTLTNIALAAGQGSTLNVTLTLAKAVTTVEVKEAPPLLQTTTATVGSEITGTEVVALPLLGRSFQSLLEFLPGVAYTPSGAYNFSIGGGGYGSTGSSNNPSVYGLRNRDNDYTIDGVPNDQVSYNGIPTYPPPETIAEMKVETGTDSGAQGWAAGANIELVTKPGTNQYHGDAWEFLQNDALNARSYFEPSLGPYKYNQFGGAIGGPLVIPHLISKERRWYFFGWYEGVRIHSATNFEGLVPTAAERLGDFSQGSDASTPIYNPYTSVLNPDGSLASRQLFPGNVIPSNLLNPTALEIDKLLYPLPNLAPGVIPGANYFNTGSSIYTYDQYSGRVDHQFGQNDNFYARMTEARNPSSSIGLPALPSGMTNNFINVAVSDTHTVSPTFIVTGRFGIQRTNPEYFGGWPSKGGPDVLKLANMTGFAPFEGRIDLMPPLSIGAYTGLSQYGGSDGPEFLYSWTVDAQKIKGRNTLALGGRIMHNSFFTDCQTGTFEDFAAAQTAVGLGTGNTLASYLLGLPASAGRLAGHTAGDDTGNMYSLYGQDSIRVTPKLTLNLGLRWDYESPFINSFGGSTFSWETDQMLWDIKNPVTGAPANARRGLVAPDYRGYQPRFGIAYSITPKTVVRSSFGVFSDGLGNTAQDEESNHGNWPFALSQTEGSLNLGLPTEFMANPFPGPLAATSVPVGLAQGENSYTPTSRTGYVYEWSASIQRQLTPSMMFEGSYVGDRGLKLTSQIVDNTALYPGTNPYQDRQRDSDFPPYVENNYNENTSLYNGLSMRLDKQFSRNLSFLVDFTWGKALDTEDGIGEGLSDSNATGEGGVDSTRFNLGQFWGDAGFDIEKVFNGTYVYHIPFKSQSKWANAVLGNWELSGDVSADSGLPYFVFIDGDNENIGYVGRYDELPNLVGNPNAIAGRTDAKWFNTAVYQMPAFGTAGNANRSTNLFSDPLFNWDSALMKRWPFAENKSFEFRAEFFNILNLSTFGAPASLVNDPNFGVVSSTRQNGREIQFALKFHF